MLLTVMNPRSCLLNFSVSIFVLLIIFFTSKNASAQPLGSSCINSAMDKDYAVKVKNVVSLLSSFASGSYKFLNTAAGIGSGQQICYGLFQCRGDVNTESCAACMQTASKEILTECPNYKTAIVWYDNCFLRYSNQTDFPNSRFLMYNAQTSNDPQRFSKYVGNLLNMLATKTSGKIYAVQEGNFTASDVVYSLAQCIPIISSTDCDTCLRAAINEIPTFCDGCLGARVLTPNCNIRFETYRFYNVVTPGAPNVDNFPKRPSSGPIKKRFMLPSQLLPTPQI